MFKRMYCRIPMNLQLFAEGGAGGTGSTGAGDAGNGAQGNQGSSAGNQSGQAPSSPAIDYDKIQKMLDGTLAAKEDTALKAYFRQQGLSEEEMQQAIAAFKQQKAAQNPDVGALQSSLRQAQEAARQARLESAATMAAVALGLDTKTVPYVLRMADLGKVMDQDGKISEEKLKNALNKVLEDVPALKPQAGQATGFKFGVSGNTAPEGKPNGSLTLKDAISEALKN